MKDLMILKGELDNIINLIKKIKIIKLYSDIYINNKNPYVSVYISALINGIYGNITNILDYKKLYLKVTPKFTEDNIKGSVKIHIKFRFSSMFKSIPIFFRIIKVKLKSKEGGRNDSSKFNTKYYGDNS